MLDALLTYPRFIGVIRPELLGRAAGETQARLRGLKVAWWPTILELQEGKRILVVAPHPDERNDQLRRISSAV